MRFSEVKCETCMRYYFDPSEVVAYQVRGGHPVTVNLGGEQPWSGVRCVCLKCCAFFGGTLAVGGTTGEGGRSDG